MTRKEAIYEFERMKTWSNDLSDNEIEAIVIALKALEQEPCGDAISRQAVLDGLASIAKAKAKSDAQKSLMGRVMFFTERLPSVTPKQRMGRWIKEGQGGRYKWMCSNCGTHHRALYDYCPSCGTRMEVEE